jgi:cell division protein FtsI/penicillin-binding protein 2
VRPTAPPDRLPLTNPRALAAIRDGLWRAAHAGGGTAAASGLGLCRFRVALKSGTAEIETPGGDTNIGWLAGFAPAAPPGVPPPPARIAFVVAVEKTSLHGAEACAAVVRRILEHFAAQDAEAYNLDENVASAGGSR